MITFNADEIFEMAEQLERNGAQFYRIAAGSDSGDSRDLLLRLAEMEDDHVKTFASMRAELSEEEKQPVTADPENQAVLYLQAMVYGKVFNVDPSATLAGTKGMEDVLDIAISLEKDSIVFYLSMKEVVPGAAGKDKLDVIIKEELGHIVDLRNQLEALK